MDIQSITNALQIVADSLPDKTTKASRDSLIRVLGILKNSKADSLEDLARDFAKPVRRIAVAPRAELVKSWLHKIGDAESNKAFRDIIADLETSAKSRKKGTLTKDELKEITKLYAGNKGLSGSVDSLIGKISFSFEERLLAAQ